MWRKGLGVLGFIALFLESLAYGVELDRVAYRPSLSLGGASYFHGASKAAGLYNLWLPLWYNQEGCLVFSDLRVFDRSGSSFEGNIHLGFRRLVKGERLWGVYGAFDQRWSDGGKAFKQLTLGGEFWRGHWFLGANYYQPVGKRSQLIGSDYVVSREKKGFGPYQVLLS